MKIYKCEKCGSTDIFIECNGNNHGLYCGDCGKWIKWLNRDEERLALRQIINQQPKKKNEEAIKELEQLKELMADYFFRYNVFEKHSNLEMLAFEISLREQSVDHVLELLKGVDNAE